MTPITELNIKLALYQYFVDWCDSGSTLVCDMAKSPAMAKKIVVEFEELKTGNYRDVYLILDNVAAYPAKWDVCKQHADYYVQTKQLHPNCYSLMSARLDGLNPQSLERAADRFLKSCYNNVGLSMFVDFHYKVYQLAKLCVTENVKYGSCYYQYVSGFYCCKIMTKKVGYQLRRLAKNYIAFDAFTFYMEARTIDRAYFMECERNAWKALVDFMKSRNLPEPYESQYLRFVFKMIDNEDYDFEGARTHQQRNKLLCCALFGCEQEFRNETSYYINKISDQ